MALWHAGRSAKASTAGPAQRRYALTACSQRGARRNRRKQVVGRPGGKTLRSVNAILAQFGVLVYWLLLLLRNVCAGESGASGQSRGLTPVSKLQERRVGADGDGIASSAGSHAIIDDARKRGQTEPARLSVRPWTPEDLLNAELRSRSSCPCATSSGARARGGTRALG
eukprot:scaffold2292_cov55-Phaeocystis_antarctica.AAC.4